MIKGTALNSAVWLNPIWVQDVNWDWGKFIQNKKPSVTEPHLHIAWDKFIQNAVKIYRCIVSYTHGIAYALLRQ